MTRCICGRSVRSENWANHLLRADGKHGFVDAIDRKALKAAIFDLPIGESVEYSRGYSAAILAVRRVIDEAPS